jgi:UDP-N-acetylmuramoylalanine--D-glutamate ligase
LQGDQGTGKSTASEQYQLVIGPNSIVVLGQEILTKDWKVYGEHNRRNAAMALLLADAILQTVGRSRGGVPPEAIEALANFRGLQHRMQWLGERNAVEVINNSMCTNPVAVIRSAESVGKPAHLLIGGVNKQLDFGPLAEFLATSSYRPYLFGTDAASIRETLGADLPIFNAMAEAFAAATQTAVAGEVIMLAPGCASTDQFRDFRDRGNVFTALAEEWLKG